jgi:hypothetical protein
LNQLLKLIPDKVKNTLNNKLFDNNDLFIFNKLISNMDYKLKDVVQLTNHNSMDDMENNVENFITQTWLNMLYFDNDSSSIESFPSDEYICRFINDKQKSLTIKDFLFKQGLAGLGFAIIKRKSTG